MAENQKSRGNGLYYFRRGQMVAVAAGFAATTLVAFLLGILIGQGIEERKLLKKEEPLVRAPLQPLTQGSKGSQAASAKEEMTFYDTLAKAPSKPQPTQTQPAREAKSAEKKAKVPVKEAKAVARKEPAQAAQKAGVKEKAGPEKTALAPEVKKPAAAKKSSEAEEAQSEAPPPEGVWTVQVNAFPDERSAQRLVERLKGKGYDAYMVPTNVRGRDWYRVRVGRFSTRDEAKGLQEELQTKEKFTKAITVSR